MSDDQKVSALLGFEYGKKFVKRRDIYEEQGKNKKIICTLNYCSIILSSINYPIQTVDKISNQLITGRKLELIISAD
jgi:hypothetical protein